MIDMTDDDEVLANDLSRTGRQTLPVNIIYPANYPNQSALLLEGLITPTQALNALETVAPSRSANIQQANPDQQALAGI